MTKQAKVDKTASSGLSKQDKVAGVVAIMLFAAGTLRAIQQEAQHNSMVVYVIGVVFVAYGLQAAFRLIRGK